MDSNNPTNSTNSNNPTNSDNSTNSISSDKQKTNKKENKFLQWISSYLYSTVKVPTQFAIPNNINMCCGIGYLVIRHQNHLISAYLDNNFEKYVKVFIILMKMASDRKLSNPEIRIEGEFLDEPTIKNDFSEIYDAMEYFEYIIGEFCEDSKKNIGVITELFDKLTQFQPIIICREVNIFVIFKLTNDEFLIVDSHIPLHGKIHKDKLINYITWEGNFNGIITLGCYKKKTLDN